MTEQAIQSKIIAYLKSQGAYYVKAIVCSRSGTPDILACHRGGFMAIEVKAEKGRVTPLQERAMDEIRKAGGVAMVARSVEEVRREWADLFADPMLADIPEFILPPFSREDVGRWHDCEEKRRAMSDE